MASLTPLSNILLKIFFPGNFIWDIWCGKPSPYIEVLARARDIDGIDGTASHGRTEGGGARPESLLDGMDGTTSHERTEGGGARPESLLDGMDGTTSHERTEGGGARPESLLDGIEYVSIEVPDSQSVVLVSHGQMRSLDPQSVEQWREWGQLNKISILLHNYPGYGRTPGPVTAKRIMEDLYLLVEFLKKRWSEEQISLLGNSIGCGPTIRLAARENYCFGKVVLISPYTSCFSCGGWLFSFFKGSRFDSFDSTGIMQKLKRQQVFMVCGEKDKTIPISNSEVLFRLLKEDEDNISPEKYRLCVLPEVNHKYTRLKALKAIALFLNDKTAELDEELSKLLADRAGVPENAYLD